MLGLPVPWHLDGLEFAGLHVTVAAAVLAERTPANGAEGGEHCQRRGGRRRL